MNEVLRMLVGVGEQHWVQVFHHRLSGGLRITVDGVPVVPETPALNFRSIRPYRFVVGTAEPHEVVIEQERSAWFPRFNPEVIRGWVDGALVATGST